MKTNYLYCDETGDVNLFRKRTRELCIGTNGCSRSFGLGVAILADPDACYEKLESLRADILSDPELLRIHSVTKKTVVAFHAKDDHPLVRQRVFPVMAALDAKVLVAFRRKDVLAQIALDLSQGGRPAKLKLNMLYRQLLKRIAKNLLHKCDANHIVFAQRSDLPSDNALHQAIAEAKRNYYLSNKHRLDVPIDKPTTIERAIPSDHAGLQVVDYHLWAFQRAMEKSDAEYFEMLRPHFRLVMDLDDKTNNGYGEWYSDSNPFALGKMKAL